MGIFRLLPASVMAALVTAALILLMHVLIQSDLDGPDKVKKFTVPEIVMPDREIETEFDTSKPEKPDEPQEAPPDLPEPEFETPDTTSEKLALRPDTAVKAQLGGISFGDGDMIPLTIVQPDYPRRAAQRGTTGYCEVRFTVTSLGTTSDITIADCPEKVFQRTTMKAASKLKFKPRVVDGKPVDAPNQGYKFVFQLQGEE